MYQRNWGKKKKQNKTKKQNQKNKTKKPPKPPPPKKNPINLWTKKWKNMNHLYFDLAKHLNIWNFHKNTDTACYKEESMQKCFTVKQAKLNWVPQLNYQPVFFQWNFTRQQ